MCRHLAYLGDQVTIGSVVLDPPHSLARQAWAPRRQRHGSMNADGFGVGWYAMQDPVPARYRRAGPIWADDSLPDLARVTRTGALLAAVRNASSGTDSGASAAAPYTAGPWLFSLNGALLGWSAAASGSPGGRHPVSSGSAGQEQAAAAVVRLAERLSPAELLKLQARCDTALIWGLVQARLGAGESAADALAGTIADIASAGGSGRFNLLLTDGTVIAATAAGDSLCYRHRASDVVVASEPFDDEPGWTDVPEGSVVEATVSRVAVRPLASTPPRTTGITQADTSDAGRPAANAAASPNGKAVRP
jgi:gamma-glutamyl hercynylcysteine S-oxide hydrolase